MKVLVLGGTVFLSRHVAQTFLARGHGVTCVARQVEGRVPAGARGVAADRANGVEAYESLEGPWDCVVDVASDPTFVREALRVLSPHARHWTYVSSCSIYADQDQPDADESGVLLDALGEGEESTLENYGASKAASEAACRAALDDRLLIVRPGLIVGPGDPSDRGGYWPARFARDREPVLVPEARELHIQTLDVRDLAEWIVASAEASLVATFNAVGESRPLSSALEEVRHVVGHQGDAVVVADQWLLDHAVAPWAGPDSLPWWIPRGLGFDGFTRRSNVAARRAGLSLRPLASTVRDTLDDERTRGLGRNRHAGLSPARESELIAEFVRAR